MNTAEKSSAVGAADEKATQTAAVLLPIAPGRISPVQEVSTRWRLVVPSVAYIKALMNNDLKVWEHVPRVQSGDIVETGEDGNSLFVEMFVRLAIRSGAGGLQHIEVVPMSYTRLGEAVEAPPATGAWSIAYMGPFKKWCLISPNAICVRDRMHTRDEAQVALNQKTAGRVGQQNVIF